VKALYPGAGLALTAGLLLGAAMKPELVTDDRPEGPQMFAGWSGARSTGPFDDSGPSYAAYRGQLPDYVLGTDWKKMAEATAILTEPPMPKIAPPAETAADAEAYAAPAADAPLGGLAAYTDAARAEKTLVVAEAEPLDADGPEEATGDTRPAR